MPIVQVQELIDAGVHYGHKASRWNPKMRPYIYGKRNLIHIIDLRETVRGLLRGYKFLNRVVAQGSLVLFVGTKRQSQEAVSTNAESCWMPYVSERWIGGTFTNFRTIRNRLQRLEELESLIRTGEIEAYSKKRRAQLIRELRKIRRNLAGIRTMNRLPGAMVIVDPGREASAVREARKLNIPTIGLIDTDSDPDKIDLAIPGNDDSIRSIDLILARLAEAIREGLGELPGDQFDKMRTEYEEAHRELQMPSFLTKEESSQGAEAGPASDAEGEGEGEPSPVAEGGPVAVAVTEDGAIAVAEAPPTTDEAPAQPTAEATGAPEADEAEPESPASAPSEDEESQS